MTAMTCFPDAIGEKRRELRKAMVDALRGRSSTVPTVRHSLAFGPVVEPQPVALALLDTLDLAICERELRVVFRDSTCPLVAALITKLANSYADALAPKAAEAA